MLWRLVLVSLWVCRKIQSKTFLLYFTELRAFTFNVRTENSLGIHIC